MTAEEVNDTKESLVEEIKTLPEREQQEVISQVVSVFQGPIPPPERMEAYKQVDPAIIDFILSDAAANAKHIRESEMKELECRATYNLKGQRYAFLITGSSLVLCVLSVIFLDSTTGNILSIIFGATGVTPIITTFIDNMKAIFKK